MTAECSASQQEAGFPRAWLRSCTFQHRKLGVKGRAGLDPLEGQGAKKKRQRILRTLIRHWIPLGLKLGPPEGFECLSQHLSSVLVQKPVPLTCYQTSSFCVCLYKHFNGMQ